MLEKRDNMGYAIPPAAIILLILLGAAFVVAGVAAVGKLVEGPNPNGIKQFTPEQMEYMKEVRDRNIDGLMSEGRRSAFPPRR